MPTYSYRCTECGNAFDIRQAFTDDSLTVCDSCDGRLRKVFNKIGVTFNGSGFYRTDSRSGSKDSGSSSDSSSGAKSGSSESSSAGTSTAGSGSSGSNTSGSGSSGSGASGSGSGAGSSTSKGSSGSVA